MIVEKQSYQYSSAQINLPEPLAGEIIAWGKKHIPEEEIFHDPSNESFGRETEMHVTILYGIHNESPKEITQILRNVEPFQIQLGTIGVFTNSNKFDVVKVNVQCDKLHRLNTRFQLRLPFTNMYNVYQPHVTIAYVKKGKGWKHNRIDKFVGRKFIADDVLFASRNNKRYHISLPV